MVLVCQSAAVRPTPLCTAPDGRTDVIPMRQGKKLSIIQPQKVHNIGHGQSPSIYNDYPFVTHTNYCWLLTRVTLFTWVGLQGDCLHAPISPCCDDFNY